ncbi:folliculin [Strongylocentrotus purpuratus]|uniref:Folliculin n=1 Tax=Strongylocentrotus purpuratus TaxID=7668 RepID=A0A7M7NQL2_STRPU|nr:folliculin [Strongylocentrotus purpuratus]
MNAVIALCHFCEIHGPRVLFCTQAHHAAEPQHVLDSKGEEYPSTFGHHFHKRPRSSTNESLSSVSSDLTTCSSASSTEHCEACRSFQPGQPGFISNDHEAKISYISSQNPEHPELFTIIRQACIRSLSCENCQGREGPIFFGEDYYGYTLSYMFIIKDTQARGLQRGYSIIVVMMDKIYLLNSWPFLVKHMKSLIDELKSKSNKVYEQEQTQRNQRAERLHREFLSPGDFYRGGVNKPFRALVVLTGDANLFKYLHMRFSWILKAGGNRITEKVLEGPPLEEAVDLDDEEVTEEGFIKVSTKPAVPSSPENPSQSEGHQSEDELEGDEGPVFSSLQHLRAVLGSLNFHDVAYNVLIGNQLIARADCKSTLKSLFKVLKVILPAGCCRIISHSPTYQASWKCNFLGLSTGTELPEHLITSEVYLLLDVISPVNLKQDSNRVVSRTAGPFKGHGISITSSSVVPDKVPTILSRIVTTLNNSDLTPEIVVTVLTTLKEEWMNKVKLLFKFTRAGSHTDEDTEKLLKILQAKVEDKPLLRFWITALSSQYRSHLLTSIMGTT